jgi:hypothetical protein
LSVSFVFSGCVVFEKFEVGDGGAAAGGLEEVEISEGFEAADEGGAGDAGEAG